jgi:glycosyltransferase involved in cell wall biosynthesis
MVALERRAGAAHGGADQSGIATAARGRGSRQPVLIYLVTEDWYFWSHRLPVACAARDAGFDVVVAARVREHGERILGQRFRLCALPWRRRGDGLAGAARALGAIAALYRRERPAIVHHVALKPVLFGAAAARLAFPQSGGRPATIAAVTGLGSGLPARSAAARIIRPALGWALRDAARHGRVIVQNPEDGAALAGFGVPPEGLALIRGSGVDTGHFAPLPVPPPGPNVTVALVSRMLRSKGVLDAVAAVRQLRAAGVAIELVLAGPTDPDNRDSLDNLQMAALAKEPGICWLGRVEDVREVWRRAAIAVLPSTYGEGIPKALLEAAACARPIVASDAPGCREAVQPGVTGLLVQPGDVGGLAAAIAALAADPGRRAAMGEAGRALIEREFTDANVARTTLALYEAAMREWAEGR